MADAVDFATGTREKYIGLPLGTRAIQLPDPKVRSYLMDVFGRPARQIVCECERTAQPNIAQALHLLNGDFLNRKIADANGRIEKGMKAKRDTKELIEELYLLYAVAPAQVRGSQQGDRLGHIARRTRARGCRTYCGRCSIRVSSCSIIDQLIRLVLTR